MTEQELMDLDFEKVMVYDEESDNLITNAGAAYIFEHNNTTKHIDIWPCLFCT